MERRVFFASMAGLAAVGSAGGIEAAPAPTSGVLVRSYLTNLTRGALDIVTVSGNGAQFRLARVRNRRFDPNSVEVRSEHGRPLGYLPGTHSRILAALMDHGVPLHARVGTVTKEPRPRIHLDVVLSA